MALKMQERSITNIAKFFHLNAMQPTLACLEIVDAVDVPRAWISVALSQCARLRSAGEVMAVFTIASVNRKSR